MEDFEKVKKNIKWIVIVAAIVACYIFFALFINNRDKINSNKYLLIGNYLIWHESKGKWYQKTAVDADVTGHKYVLYNGTSKYNADTLQFLSNKWHFFDKDYNSIPTNDFKFAYTGIDDIKPTDYEIQTYDSGDDDIIKEVTKVYDNNLLNNYRGTLLKLSLDFDGDGSIETIYRFTNFKLDIMDYTVKTYLVLVKNNTVIDTISSSNSDVFEIMEVIDLDNDGKKEVVIGKDVVDIPTFYSCYQIYKINDNDLQLYQDCLFEK